MEIGEARNMTCADLTVRMLGDFSISLGGQTIADASSRSRKMWLLLAYLIYCRNRPVSQEDLLRLLWEEDEGSANPLNALKTMLHRARSVLNQLGPDAGHHLIVRQGGCYLWNPTVPLKVDAEEFETLCREGAAAQDGDVRLDKFRRALALYQGDFLEKLSAEPWVVPIAAYFHHLYVETAQAAVALLEERGRPEEVVSLCREALRREPCGEALYRSLMRALLALGRQQEVLSAYEEMSDLLLTTFGVMPEEETRALYREAARTVNDRALTPEDLQAQLREPPSQPGAMLCDYDFFRVIYHAEARAVARNGNAVHIALLSVAGEEGEDLPRRSLDLAMDHLQEVIRGNLRKGDVAARCSLSQFILMLPQANFENSRMVCDRIVRAFARQYPHSPARLHCSVHPLEPNV